jgi:hypothetical protein
MLFVYVAIMIFVVAYTVIRIKQIRETIEDNFYQTLTFYEIINTLHSTLRNEKVHNTNDESLLKNDK